jgi:signal transduction histidine kinase
MAAGNQMVRLTETLLERQRLEDGHLEPDNEPFHFPTVLDTSLQQVFPLLTLHRLTVQRILPDDLPLVFADPHVSQRILENLLDNAIKFSPREGEIIIRITDEQSFIKISIEDQGPGIPKEEQAAIFEQFTQLKSEENSWSRGGFGLGLAFCQLATQAMGGTIWVESDGESGTKFLFTVPSYNLDNDLIS